jgi:hypothetical protein
MRDVESIEFVSSVLTARAADEFAQRRPRPRRNSRPRIAPADVTRMVRAFTASGRDITICPPAYSVPSPQYRRCDEAPMNVRREQYGIVDADRSTGAATA